MLTRFWSPSVTDEHGEVCPANWDESKNNATIKPDPTSSKEYFASANKE